MEYVYGEFTNKQIKEAVRAMHSDIHRLLLYKDKKNLSSVQDYNYFYCICVSCISYGRYEKSIYVSWSGA